MSLEITPVSGERELEIFLSVPSLLRPRSDVNRVPGRWVRPVLDRRSNPYFRHADHALLIAWREGRPVGRVAVFYDHLCNRTLGQRAGSFGLFDCLDSPRVASQLLAGAERWLEEQGALLIRGPLGPTLRLGTGVLIEGHDQPTMPGLTYDPPEVGALIEGAGYLPELDLQAWRLETGPLPREVAAAADEARRRPGLSITPFRLARFDEDIQKIHALLNDQPGQSWTCAPWTLDEVRWMASKLWTVFDPSLVVFAEQDGAPAALGLALRNLREVLGGRSPRPTVGDSLRLAWARWRSGVSSARISLLTVGSRFDGAPAGGGSLRALLLSELLLRLRLLGVRWAEVSLVDSTDRTQTALLEAAGARVYKTYRVYQKSLAG